MISFANDDSILNKTKSKLLVNECKYIERNLDTFVELVNKTSTEVNTILSLSPAPTDKRFKFNTTDLNRWCPYMSQWKGPKNADNLDEQSYFDKGQTWVYRTRPKSFSSLFYIEMMKHAKTYYNQIEASDPTLNNKYSHLAMMIFLKSAFEKIFITKVLEFSRFVSGLKEYLQADENELQGIFKNKESIIGYLKNAAEKCRPKSKQAPNEKKEEYDKNYDDDGDSYLEADDLSPRTRGRSGRGMAMKSSHRDRDRDRYLYKRENRLNQGRQRTGGADAEYWKKQVMKLQRELAKEHQMRMALSKRYDALEHKYKCVSAAKMKVEREHAGFKYALKQVQQLTIDMVGIHDTYSDTLNTNYNKENNYVANESESKQVPRSNQIVNNTNSQSMLPSINQQNHNINMDMMNSNMMNANNNGNNLDIKSINNTPNFSPSKEEQPSLFIQNSANESGFGIPATDAFPTNIDTMPIMNTPQQISDHSYSGFGDNSHYPLNSPAPQSMYSSFNNNNNDMPCSPPMKKRKSSSFSSNHNVSMNTSNMNTENMKMDNRLDNNSVFGDEFWHRINPLNYRFSAHTADLNASKPVQQRSNQVVNNNDSQPMLATSINEQNHNMNMNMMNSNLMNTDNNGNNVNINSVNNVPNLSATEEQPSRQFRNNTFSTDFTDNAGFTNI